MLRCLSKLHTIYMIYMIYALTVHTLQVTLGQLRTGDRETNAHVVIRPHFTLRNWRPVVHVRRSFTCTKCRRAGSKVQECARVTSVRLSISRMLRCVLFHPSAYFYADVLFCFILCIKNNSHTCGLFKTKWTPSARGADRRVV